MQTIPSMSSTSTVRAACAAIRGSAAAAASATADDHATKRRRRRASAVTNEPIGTSNTAADAIAISQETNMALQSTAREQTRNSGSSNIVGRAEVSIAEHVLDMCHAWHGYTNTQQYTRTCALL